MTRIVVAIIFMSLVACAAPIARYEIESDNYKVPTVVRFINNSEKSDHFSWSFGDGNTSTVESPLHKYLLSGKYEIKLTSYKGKKQNTLVKEIILKAPDDCLVYVVTTHGDMLIKLYDETPNHRDNFLAMVDRGFYNEMLFHRVINGFMIQSGDPDSKTARKGQRLGMGGPGYTLPAEINKNLVHIKGALAAARQGDDVNPEKRSSGSQFYLVHGVTQTAEQIQNYEYAKDIKYSEESKSQYMNIGGSPQLDMEYTVFGRVVEGLETIDKIATAGTDGNDRPVDDIRILKMIQIK